MLNSYEENKEIIYIANKIHKIFDSKYLIAKEERLIVKQTLLFTYHLYSFPNVS